MTITSGRAGANTVAMPRRSVPRLALRIVAAAALVTSGYIHLDLSSTYWFGPAINEGQLFLIQGVVAILIALWLLIRDSRLSWLVATGLMAASCTAVIYSTMHQIPAIGPLPSLYEPVWYAEKMVSAVVEGSFVVLALGRFALRRR